MIKLHPDKSGYILGIDVGGTKICISCITREGERIHTDFYKSDQSSQKNAVDTILGSIDHFIDKYCKTPPARIGIGIRGHIDNEKGIWLTDTMIPDLSAVPLKSIIEEKFQIQTVIDNDIHCAALAELFFGAGKTCNDFIYMNIGTGIAVGIVSDRRLVRGESNYSGEFGHTLVDSKGERCKCGFYGCLEPIASGDGISQQVMNSIKQYPSSQLNDFIQNGKIGMPAIFTAYDRGDALAQSVIDKAVESLTIGIVNLINLLDPGAIIFGGGVVSDGWLLPKVEANVRKYKRKKEFKTTIILRESSLGSKYVGVLGAACLGLETLKN